MAVLKVLSPGCDQTPPKGTGCLLLPVHPSCPPTAAGYGNTPRLQPIGDVTRRALPQVLTLLYGGLHPYPPFSRGFSPALPHSEVGKGMHSELSE